MPFTRRSTIFVATINKSTEVIHKVEISTPAYLKVQGTYSYLLKKFEVSYK